MSSSCKECLHSDKWSRQVQTVIYMCNDLNMAKLHLDMKLPKIIETILIFLVWAFWPVLQPATSHQDGYVHLYIQSMIWVNHFSQRKSEGLAQPNLPWRERDCSSEELHHDVIYFYRDESCSQWTVESPERRNHFLLEIALLQTMLHPQPQPLDNHTQINHLTQQDTSP